MECFDKYKRSAQLRSHPLPNDILNANLIELSIRFVLINGHFHLSAITGEVNIFFKLTLLLFERLSISMNANPHDSSIWKWRIE